MKVTFFTTWNKKCGIADYSHSLISSLEKKGVTVEVVPVKDAKKITYYIIAGRRLNNADLAHIQHEYSFFSNSRLPFVYSLMSAWHFYILLRQIKISKIITLHELATWAGKNPLLRFLNLLYSMMHAIFFKKFDHIIVHTNRFREALMSIGIDGERITVFPVPVPIPKTPLLLYNDDVHLFKNSLSIEHNKKILTIFGFVNARKGYEAALPAIKDLKDCILLIAGGPHPEDRSGYFENLIAKVKKLNLNEKVIILGFLPEQEIYKVMISTDIFLAPFLDASGSASLSYIAAYKKPIIASDISTATELREMGLGLELFKSGDIGDLRDKILYLLNNDDRQKKMIELTKEFVEKYNYDSFAKVIHRLYEQKYHESR